MGQALDHRGLAYSWLPDQDGVVLGFARQDADDPADLAVATDDGVQLSRPRLGDEVDAVLLERLVGVFRVGACHSLVAANRAQSPQQFVATGAMLPEDFRCVPLAREDGEDQVLDRHELILEAVGLLLGIHQHLLEIPRHADVRCVAGQTRSARERRFQLPADFSRRRPCALEEAAYDPGLLVQRRQEQVFRIDLLVMAFESFAARLLKGFLRFLRQLVEVHFQKSSF